MRVWPFGSESRLTQDLTFGIVGRAWFTEGLGGAIRA